MSAEWLADRLVMLIPLWFSLSVHECAHAWAALRLGDDTAQRLGRLTINPLAHIDPVGTLLLPLLGVPFGWARPVPVQPHRFHPGVNMRTGMMLTAIAGPLANLALALASIVVLVLLARFQPAVLQREPTHQLLLMMIFMNVILACFNCLPIPPLDGSRVVDALVPNVLRGSWEGFCRMGPLALAAVIILPHIMHVDLFRWPMELTVRLILQLARLVS